MKTNIFRAHSILRKQFLHCLLALLAWLIMPMAGAQSINDITLNVYKELTCGCCVGWIEHMDERGYSSNVHHPRDIGKVKAELGLKPEWTSCHTAVTQEGFIFEGHIP